MYCLAADLILLATKAQKAGDTVSAAKLFCQACITSDVHILNEVICLNNYGSALSNVELLDTIEPNIVEAFALELSNTEAPVEDSDLRNALKKLREHSEDTGIEADEKVLALGKRKQPTHEPNISEVKSNYGENEDLEDIEFDANTDKSVENPEVALDEEIDLETDDNDNEEPVDDGSDEDLDIESDMDTDEQDLYIVASVKDPTEACDPNELDEETKNKLVSDISDSLMVLKLGKEDHIASYLPIILNMFPDLALDPNADRDVSGVIRLVLNRLNNLNSSKLMALHNVTRGLIG